MGIIDNYKAVSIPGRNLLVMDVNCIRQRNKVFIERDDLIAFLHGHTVLMRDLGLSPDHIAFVHGLCVQLAKLDVDDKNDYCTATVVKDDQ